MKTERHFHPSSLIIYGFTILFSFFGCKKDSEIVLPNIATLIIKDISVNSAKSGGSISGNNKEAIITYGVVWSTNEQPTIKDNVGFTSESNGEVEYESIISELLPKTTYYVRAYATCSNRTVYGDQLSFKTYTVNDIDGNNYSSTLIGNQEWLAENLRTTKYNNGDPIITRLDGSVWGSTLEGAYSVYYYGDIAGLTSQKEVLNAYGILYNWYAVVDERGLCPDGWHMPSNEEWAQLIDYLGDNSIPNTNTLNGAGNALKSYRQVNHPNSVYATSIHPRWDYNNTHYGKNAFGFSALPGGVRNTNGNFYSVGLYGYWWSRSEYDKDRALGRIVFYNSGDVSTSASIKQSGESVRCIRD